MLSAAMLDAEALDTVLPMLRPADFYSFANEKIFAAIGDLYDHGQNVDIVSVAGWLRDREQLAKCGGAQYVAQISDATPAVAHVEDHANRVREKSQLRQAIRLCQETAALGYGDVGNVSEFLDEAEQKLSDITHRPEATQAVPVKDLIASTFDRLAAAAERGDAITGISTGFIDLDKKLAGLHKGTLLLIGARPGAGKSALALNIARWVPHSGKDAVVFFSLEMPKEELMVRLICSEARVDGARLRTGQTSADEWADLTKASTIIAQLPLLIDDDPQLSLRILKAKVRRMKREHAVKGLDLSVVVIDYLQLMQTPRAENREQRVAAVTRGLKLMARELDIAIILLVQLNRALESRSTKDKRPRLSDIRETGAAEQDADTILFIYRPEMYQPDSADVRGLAEIVIGKQRNGPTGAVWMRWFGHCTRFDTLASHSYPEREDYD